MTIPDQAAGLILACPVGCAFLLTVKRDQVPIEDAVTPNHAFEIAATALLAFDPWSDSTKGNIAAALAQAPELKQLAQQIVQAPGARWWFEPLDRQSQLWLPAPRLDLAAGPQKLEIPTPSGDAVAWSGPYGEHFAGWQATSTARDGLTMWEVTALSGVGNWDSGWRPTRYEVNVADDARVFEIRGPDDWHDLCARYPAVNTNAQNQAVPGVLVPDWAHVASDWDGVHLTFFGLLTTPWVRAKSGAGRSMLWSWDTEWTIWLRDDVLAVRKNLGPTMADFLGGRRPSQGRGWSGEEWLKKYRIMLPEKVRTEAVNEVLGARPASTRTSWGVGKPSRLIVTSPAGEARFTCEPGGEWQLQQSILASGKVEEGKTRPSYRPLHLDKMIPDLDTEFDPDQQMAPSTELRKRSFGELLAQLKHSSKLLITHRSKPEAVVLPYDLYRRLVRHTDQLQRMLKAERSAVEADGEPLSARTQHEGPGGRDPFEAIRQPPKSPPKQPPVLRLNEGPPQDSIARHWIVSGELDDVVPDVPPNWPKPVEVSAGGRLTLSAAAEPQAEPAECEVWVRNRVDDRGVPRGKPVFQERLYLDAEDGTAGERSGWQFSFSPDLPAGTYYLVAQLSWPNREAHVRPQLGLALMASYIFRVTVSAGGS